MWIFAIAHLLYIIWKCMRVFLRTSFSVVQASLFFKSFSGRIFFFFKSLFCVTCRNQLQVCEANCLYRCLEFHKRISQHGFGLLPVQWYTAFSAALVFCLTSLKYVSFASVNVRVSICGTGKLIDFIGNTKLSGALSNCFSYFTAFFYSSHLMLPRFYTFKFLFFFNWSMDFMDYS